MKKVLLVFAVAAAVAFTSCKKEAPAESTSTDSVAVEAPVEEAVADSTASDSTAVAADSTAK
ncbi:MAG: hypothetical protein K2Q22_00150 [Cytophagales bacterium]|nr:hypothetical protein [Cytophagales bacterium]